MRDSGMSCRAIARQLGYHHSVITRLVQKHAQTNDVKDRVRSGRPRATSVREDRALLRHVRRLPFTSAPVLRDYWNTHRRVSITTIRNRLHVAGYRARRPLKRPKLTQRHINERLVWCRARARWNLASWRRIHWSDECRMLLHAVDGRIRVWRQRNTRFAPRHVQPTYQGGGGSVMIWGCVSFRCKLDLVTIPGTLTGEKYRDNILQPVVIPHFDNHPLRSRPVYMDDNARPHRARVVTEVLQREAITTLPWPACSPDLNPIEHLWDILGRRIRRRDPPVQTVAELDAALHQEWQQVSQQTIQRLIRSMSRRVNQVINAHGSYTRY